MQSIGDVKPSFQTSEISKVIASMPKAQETEKKEKTKVSNENDLEQEKEPIVDAALERANHQLKTIDKRIDRSVHEITKAVIYKVVDTSNGDILSEYPSKRVQDVVGRLMQMNGLVFDRKI
jgi:flagellar protein FlaG